MLNLRELWKTLPRLKCLQKAKCDTIDEQIETQLSVKVLPELVWQRIADHLYGNADILNLSNSSQFIRNSLLHKRIAFLFEPVLQILTTNLLRQHSADKTEVKSLILSCRLVCHSWVQAIDHLCPHKWYSNCKISPTLLTGPIEVITQSPVVGQVIGKRFDCSHADIQNIKKFISKFECHDFKYLHTIFGHGISITFNGHTENDAVEAEFHRALNVFLDTFGHYIYNCSIVLNHCRRKLETYLKVVELLRALPNLQNLFISDMDENHCSPFETSRVLGQTRLSLEYLKTAELCNIGIPLCNEIISNNLQINKVHISKYSCQRRKVNGFNLVGCPDNLQELELRGFNWREIRELRFPNFPVKRLRLGLNANLISWNKNHWVEFVEFFSKRFGETVEDLLLEAPNFCDRKSYRDYDPHITDNQKAWLNMPQVKRMRLRVPNSCSFDFLLGMKGSLEYLDIGVDTFEIYMDQYWRGKEGNRNDIVNIDGYHNKMYKSNIWKLFPKLEAVKLTAWRHYSSRSLGGHGAFRSISLLNNFIRSYGENVGWKSWEWTRRKSSSGKLMKKWDVKKETG